MKCERPKKESKIPVPMIQTRPRSATPVSSRREKGRKASSTQQTLVSLSSQTSDYYSETDVSSSSSSSSKCGGVEEWRQHKLSTSHGIYACTMRTFSISYLASIAGL